jgi:hypothetical protein
LDSSIESLEIKTFGEKIKSLIYFNSKKKVKYVNKYNKLRIDLEKSEMNDIDTILELTIKS